MLLSRNKYTTFGKISYVLRTVFFQPMSP